MPVQLAILEDDKTIRESLCTILGQYGTIIAKASFDNAEDFIKAMPLIEIDVAIIDITLPGMDGIECIFELKPKYPLVQFLIFTVIEDDDKIFEALCSGASGYLLKSSTTEEISQAIIDVHNGGSPMTSSIARKVVQSFNNAGSHQLQFNLTTREKELLRFLEKGLRYKEISDSMDITLDTVRSHIRNIYYKLQVQSRTDALNKYYQRK